MTIKEIETRSAEIREAMTSEDADLKSLIEEAKELKTRKAELIAEQKEKELEAEVRKAEMSAVIEGKGEVIEKKEKVEMTEKVEVRNSKEYIDAYAKYIKTEDATECRALLSENGGGTVLVPDMVYDIVKTAWEKDGIMALVKKTYIKGNLKVGFEVSSDGAVIHTEGGDPIDPENLVLGAVTLVPQSVKKLVQISDEALDLSGEAFLRYIYDEIAYQIAKKVASTLLGIIEACGTVSTATCPSVPVVTEATIGIDTVAKAMAKLSAEASNPVVVLNRGTWGALKSAQAQASYGYDPFEGLKVVFNNDVKAYAVATTGDTYMVVGDFEQGAIANFPNGGEIKFKFDDMSGASADMVNIIGRQFVGLGVVANDSFVKVQK